MATEHPTGNAATARPQGSPRPTPLTQAEADAFAHAVADGLNRRWQGGQAIVVRADGADSPGALLWLFEKAGGEWRVAAGPWQAVVGKNGVGKRAENDGRSPSGAFLLGTAFGWGERPAGMAYQYRRLDGADRWVDAPTPFYNRWVRGSDASCGAGEALMATPAYEHALVVHYNDEAMSGAGSAIFLHVWSGPGRGTLGCTAMDATNLETLLCRLDYAKRPVLVQGTDAEIKALLGAEWGIGCLPKGWGYLDDFLPDVQPELRYFTAHNFTGDRLPGYLAPVLPMRLEAIQALEQAADGLRKRGLGLRVYDAYRPQTATDAMVAWAQRPGDATKAEFYPDIPKSAIPGVYVAHHSNHRLGGTADLTLLDWSTGANLDMGGSFDFFGERSHYRFRGLTGAQRANRALLRDAMTAAGFRPYGNEWWHFALPVDGSGGEFPIEPRQFLVRE